MLRTTLLITFLAAFGAPACADEVQKKPEPEVLPAPKTKIEPAVEIAPFVPPRRYTLDVWQHYGVSPLGRFVPRVIVTEFGPLYSRDLQPYPFMQNRRTAVRP
jgi:hypothetical protein